MVSANNKTSGCLDWFVIVLLLSTPALSGCSELFSQKELPGNLTFRARDDRELAPTIIVARKKFNIFRDAFKLKKNGDHTVYNVKFPVTEGDATEHFWIQVTSVDGDKISGKFDCDGFRTKSVHTNDSATTSVNKIDDWMVDDGKKAKGAFSVLILEKDNIAQTNHINQSDPVESEAQKQKLLKHWQELVVQTDGKKSLELEPDDANTVVNVRLTERLFKGNSGVDASPQQLADICGLPVELTELIRHLPQSQ